MKTTTKGVPVIPTLPMAALLAMKTDDLLAMARTAVETEQNAKQASSNHKASFSALGKVVAALKAKFNAEAAGSSLVASMTFAEYYDLKTGSKPNNHAESCAKCFGAFVNNGMIEEKDYDACAASWLETAAAIITEVKGDLTHEAVAKTADVLKVRHKDGMKTLESILEGLKGPKTVEWEKAVKQLDAMAKSGHLERIIYWLGAEFGSVKDVETAVRLFGAVDTCMALLGKDLAEFPDAVDAFIKAKDAAEKKPEMKTGADAQKAT